MTESYVVVVPSRKRVDGARNVQRLIPGAVVYVEESEAQDYAGLPGPVMRHPPAANLAEIRNMLLKEFEEPVVVIVEDDFVGVRVVNEEKVSRPITDPNVILDIIENTMQVAEDLDVGAFGWSRSGNPALFFGGQPLGLTSPLAASFGVRGSARHRTFDPRFYPRADLDWNMRCLLEDRITFCDRRFYFDHGAIFGGTGGAVGTIKADQWNVATDRLKRSWGVYLKCDGSSQQAVNKKGTRKTTAVSGMSIRVPRRSSLVHT